MKSAGKPAVVLAFVILAECAAAAPVSEIRIENTGPGPGDESFVRAQIGSAVGEELDQYSVTKDIRNLIATKRFSDVKVEVQPAGDGVTLVYVLSNRLRLSGEPKVEGTRHIGPDRVRKIFALSPDEYVDESVLATCAQKLKKEYKEDGYPHAEVTWLLDTVDQREGTVRLTVHVNEGRRQKVKEAVFEGNKSISNYALRRAVGGYSWWNPVRWFGFHGYDLSEPDVAKEAILRTYLTRGFLDAKVYGPEWTETESGGRRAVFRTEEGAVYRLGEVSFVGTSLFPETELAKLVTLRPGDVVAADRLAEIAGNLRTYYTSRGYLRTSVRYALKPADSDDNEGNAVDLVFTVGEGNLMYIRNIFIRGNTATREEVIRRELTVYPGEVFDERRIKKSEQRLRNLGYFSRVFAYPEATSDLKEHDLVFDVQEQRTGMFMIGGGFSSIDRFIGFIEITERNFDVMAWPPKGGGQRLKLRGQFGTRTTLSELSLVEPWFLGRRLSMELDLYASGTDYDDYDVRKKGASVGVGRAIHVGPFNRADVRYRLEDVDISDITDTNEYATIDGDPYYFEYASELKSRLSLTLTRETRDNYFFPSRGHRIIVSGHVEGGFLGGDSELHGWQVKAEQYYPLWLDHVIGIKGRLQLVNETGDSEMQIFDRLFVGGGRTIRGFDYRGVGPKVSREVEGLGVGETASVYRMTGGRSLAMASAEYVIPIVEQIRVAAFVDAGNVWEDAYDFDFTSLAVSTGLELRFDMPQFPVKINYAWILAKDDPATEEHKWGFWIGSGF